MLGHIGYHLDFASQGRVLNITIVGYLQVRSRPIIFDATLKKKV